MLQSKELSYHSEGTTLNGYYVYDDAKIGPRPGVLVCHDWSGRNAFAMKKAEHLATLGYVGFALDMYGNGQLGTTKEEKSTLMQPVVQHRQTTLLARLNAALAAIRTIPECDSRQIAIIGFCFGGLCALDLARSGADIKAAISIHGLLNRDPAAPIKPIQAKILALHGYDDPMVPKDAMIAFADEMTSAKTSFEINIYGHTMHAFTNPEANDPGFGTVYQPEAAKRAAIAMETFLQGVFGG